MVKKRYIIAKEFKYLNSKKDYKNKLFQKV